MAKRTLNLVLFFTWDVSLALWQEKGLLQREIKLYQELVRFGVRPTFVSWGGKEDHAIAAALGPDIRTVSVYDRIPSPKNQVLRALCSLMVPFVLRKELREADILKTNQMWGGWVPAISKWISRKPLIVRNGFELYDFTLRQGHGKLRRWFIWLISRMTYGAGDHICLATEEDRDFVIEHFDQKPAKISVHPNWIDTDVFKPEKQLEREKSVLFVGRMAQQKNLPMLIDALSGTGLTLDIAGDGEMKDELEARAKEKKVPVNFLGKLPNDELPALYNSYKVFVLPSFFEGNPKSLLEAMACGRAVVGTDVDGIASVIRHEKTGLLSPLDPVSLRVCIQKLMHDPALRSWVGTAARQQIIETQTLDSLVARELACYKSLGRKKKQ